MADRASKIKADKVEAQPANHEKQVPQQEQEVEIVQQYDPFSTRFVAPASIISPDSDSVNRKPQNRQALQRSTLNRLQTLAPVERHSMLARNPDLIHSAVFDGKNSAVNSYLNGATLSTTSPAIQRDGSQEEEQQQEEQAPAEEAPQKEAQAAAPPPAENNGGDGESSDSGDSGTPADSGSGDAGEGSAQESPPSGQGSPSDSGDAAESSGSAQQAQPEMQGAGGASAQVDMEMPEPQDSVPDDGVRSGVAAASSSMSENASQQADMPPAQENVNQARGEVEEPEEETSARAEGEAVAELGENPDPSPEIVELANRIREDIRSKRPPDKDALENTDPKQMAEQAGGNVEQTVQGEVSSVEGNYDELEQEQQGSPEQTSTPAEDIPSQEPQEVDVQQATPEPSSEADVSLDADVEASQDRMADAGMDTEAAQLAAQHAPDGPLVEATQAQGELEESAAVDPAQVIEEQQAAIGSAEVDMQELQARAAEYLANSRENAVTNVENRREGLTGSEEQMRQQAGQQANQIYDTAQQQVHELLDGLPEKAMARWDTEVELLSTNFENSLTTVKQYIDERHEGFFGGLVSAWDSVVGLPDEIVEEYDRAEKAFGDGVANLLIDISTEVNSVIASCQAIIRQAKNDIDALFASLPESLQSWAEEQKSGFQEQLDGLSSEVMAARDNFEQNLSSRATTAVTEVRQRVADLRAKAGGILGRIADAISAFIEDPGRFIIEGLLSALGIAPAAFWAVVDKLGDVIGDIAEDPLGFANNLVKALGQGFQNFFDNIQEHLSEGMLNWLFDSFGKSGIELPSDFSLPSLMSFFMGMMGITWDFIRSRIVKFAGSQAVEIAEKAIGMVQGFMEMGPQGLFELVKEKLDPNGIMDMIMQSAIDFLAETLIGQAIMRIATLFNPAGAIIQGVQLIYTALTWIFDQAGELFQLVETIVGGVGDLIAGNIGGMAAKVHEALAMALPVVLNFLARLLGLGKIPEKIGDIIKSLRDRVQKALDEVIEFVVEKAKGLLKRLGGGGDEDEEENKGETSGSLSEEDMAKFAAGKADIKEEEKQYLNNEQEITTEEAETVAATVKSRHDIISKINVIETPAKVEYEVISRMKDSSTTTDRDDDATGLPRQLDTNMLVSFQNSGDSNHEIALSFMRANQGAKLTVSRAVYREYLERSSKHQFKILRENLAAQYNISLKLARDPKMDPILELADRIEQAFEGTGRRIGSKDAKVAAGAKISGAELTTQDLQFYKRARDLGLSVKYEGEGKRLQNAQNYVPTPVVIPEE